MDCSTNFCQKPLYPWDKGLKVVKIGQHFQVCCDSAPHILIVVIVLVALTYWVSFLQVIDMVKDEMVKQGKSRGTGRPGRVWFCI